MTYINDYDRTVGANQDNSGQIGTFGHPSHGNKGTGGKQDEGGESLKREPTN